MFLLFLILKGMHVEINLENPLVYKEQIKSPTIL